MLLQQSKTVLELWSHVVFECHLNKMKQTNNNHGNNTFLCYFAFLYIFHYVLKKSL